jgi:FAD:protein FMN transferase
MNGRNALDRFEYSTATMGTILRCSLYAEDEHQAQEWLDAGLSELERSIPAINNYDPTSEISKLNKQPGTPVRVSDDLWNALQHAQRWWELSQGTFDVTFGSLFSLWRSARKTKMPPNNEEVQQALRTTGWNNVRLDDQTVTILVDGLQLDLSGLATGWLMDRAFAAMENQGAHSFLLDIGGDIRLGAPPPEKAGWKVTIAGLSKTSLPFMELFLSQCAITTSGDRNQSLEFQNRRYSHLIDPRVGEPMEFPQSATVIAKTTLDADAGATAMAILGRTLSDEQFASLPLERCLYVFQESNAIQEDKFSFLQPVRYRNYQIKK